MTKQLYYIVFINKPEGPYSIEQLEKNRLDENTLVCLNGSDKWIKAKDVEELKSIIIFNPPPIPDEAKIPMWTPFALKLFRWFKYASLAVIIIWLVIYISSSDKDITSPPKPPIDSLITAPNEVTSNAQSNGSNYQTDSNVDMNPYKNSKNNYNLQNVNTRQSNKSTIDPLDAAILNANKDVQKAISNPTTPIYYDPRIKERYKNEPSIYHDNFNPNTDYEKVFKDHQK